MSGDACILANEYFLSLVVCHPEAIGLHQDIVMTACKSLGIELTSAIIISGGISMMNRGSLINGDIVTECDSGVPRVEPDFFGKKLDAWNDFSVLKCRGFLAHGDMPSQESSFVITVISHAACFQTDTVVSSDYNISFVNDTLLLSIVRDFAIV